MISFHGGFFDPVPGAGRIWIKNDRLRISIILLFVAVCSSLPWFGAVALLALLALMAIRLYGISWKYAGLRSLLAVPFGLGAVILLPLSVPEKGVGTALLLFAKLFAANWAVTVLLATTPVPVLLRTLNSLHVPPPFIEMIAFTLRYAAVLCEEASGMIAAQRARGMEFKVFSSWRRYRKTGQLLGHLLNRSLARSVRIHQAMLARGYLLNYNELKDKEKGVEPDGRHQNRASFLSLSRRYGSSASYIPAGSVGLEGGYTRPERRREIDVDPAS